MRPDLNLYPLVIDANRIEDFNWVYQGADQLGPRPIDLDDLAVDVDWSRRRMIWMIYGSCHPGSIKEVLARVTLCSRVVVLEAESPDAYHLTISERDELRQHLLAERLTIIAGGPVLQRAVKLLELVDINTMDGWKPIVSQMQMNVRPFETRQLFEKVAAGINTMIMGKAAIHSVTLPYLRNALINAPLASGGDYLQQWQGMRKDRPALIVAAGPSLNKQLPLLAQNQDLFTIIAVDKVWPILKAHGIVPDAILALDPKSVPSWPRNEIDRDTAFCVDIGCGSKLLWSNDHNHLLTCANVAVYKILKELGIEISLLSTGGSVATSAFALAERLGANPIVLIGQDLALTGGKDHADGYLNSYNAGVFSARFEAGFDVEGYYGDRLRTERQLLTYKSWFENRIKALPEKLIINSTEGGARIEGSVQLPFSTVCQEIRSAKIFKKPLILPFKSYIQHDHIHLLIEGLMKIRNGIDDMNKLAQKGHKLCLKMGENPNLKQLKKLDKLNLALKTHQQSSKSFLDILNSSSFDEIRYKTQTGENMNGMADAVRQYDNIYIKIISSVGYAKEIIDNVHIFYKKLIECNEIDPEILRYASLN
ncbi:6-hydroxymethylpterin diphosphokinase MptE-like protein [Limnohabitans sp. Rim8]|uniref:motility associated factor glycosyltransferase family protein n=1 Tax=Limnohabitans sp. Rim8 TaxID=1100718 RepID=UPI0025DBB094|nr:6-hydroxymethylpterin diphosphokinase MptE-like protein [Limnohabitans sp. Rim8]